MSGGVDSAVVAALLHEGGHEVIGATLQLYDNGATAARRGACCAGRDIHDARRVADRLGIAHYVVDGEERFRETVIAPFAASYAAGETPVPCVRCNMGVKFTDLLGLARELGCEAMATGHYVRRVDGPEGAELHRPRATSRDQSWFLFATTRAQLDFLRFPLGAMDDKADVRREAGRLGLPVAGKHDSQDICFVPDGDHAALVAAAHPEAAAAGEIVDERGRTVGRHAGVARYTVGQTKRLGAAAQLRGVRQAVRRIEPASGGAVSGRIVIGPRDEGGTTNVHLREVNWLVAPPTEARATAVQLRAREEPRAATIRALPGGRALVTLAAGAHPAPGQACVAYEGSRILGGGFIEREDAPARSGRNAA